MADLPDSYDLIVVGTGMPECIMAAAAARVGKSVLHLDRNPYYGGLWASFNLEFLIQWISKQQESSGAISQRLLEANWLEQLNDDEHLILCPKRDAVASNVVQKTYVRESSESAAGSRDISIEDIDQEANIENDHNADIENDYQAEAVNSNDQQANLGDNQQNNNATEEQAATEQQREPSLNLVQEDVIEQEQPHENQVEVGGQVSSNDSTERVPQGEDSAAQVVGEEQEISANASNEPQGEEAVPTIEVTGPPENLQNQAKEWTLQDLLQSRHKFNIDLSPKLLFSRGSLVELLVSSNTARYADFQSVSRILTLINGHLEQVPCSRADVFSTKNVNVVEKRMLMKLLTFCLEYQKHPDEYRGFEGRPFIEFLRSRKITPNIEHYILHAIAMVDESCLTLQGLQATQKFMESLGRYGNSPFLWTCYGSAEIPQCFCRLCAVFGGIYYLGRDADAVILDSNNHCAGIISQGKKLKCPSIVMEYSYAPMQYCPEGDPKMISRAVYITDSSILPSERQQNTFLRLPPISGTRSAITVLEFNSLSYICPRGLCLVHMTCDAFAVSAAEDFLSAEQELFVMPSDDTEEVPDSDHQKPKVLWSLHFRYCDVSSQELNSGLPSGIFLTSTPGSEIDYEHAVKEARDIFDKLYPGEEFLPRAPDPEDIVLEEHSNPGDDTENSLSACEENNLENKMNVESVAEEQCAVGDHKCQSVKSSHMEFVEKGVEATEDTQIS